jgi:hypothetical protein
MRCPYLSLGFDKVASVINRRHARDLVDWLLIRNALLLHYSNVYHLVLHRQMLTWAMRSTVNAELAANNHLRSWLVRINTEGVAATVQ